METDPHAESIHQRPLAQSPPLAHPPAEHSDRELPADMTIEQAWDSIAGMLSATGDSPAAIMRALHAKLDSVQQLQSSLATERKLQIKQHVQIANMAAEVFKLRQQLVEVEAAAQPDVVQLKSLLCDPAVAREFALMREDNVRLQAELQRCKDALQVSTTNPQSKLGRKMAERFSLMQEENDALALRLKTVEELRTQLSMTGSYAERLQKAYSQLEAHTLAQDAELEDLHNHLISMRKSDGRHPAAHLHKKERPIPGSRLDLRAPGPTDHVSPPLQRRAAADRPERERGYDRDHAPRFERDRAADASPRWRERPAARPYSGRDKRMPPYREGSHHAAPPVRRSRTDALSLDDRYGR